MKDFFAPAEQAAIKAPDRMMGRVLVNAGKLSVRDAERILQLQRERQLRFGDAAKALGVLTDADIEFALSRQFEYPYLRPGESKVSQDVVAAYDPFSPQVEVFRTLRTQLTLRLLDNDASHKSIAILSAARHEGRSYVAANLAVMFAQSGRRTVLLDADLRNPCQHLLFGLEKRAGLSEVLSGRAGAEALQRIEALPNLSLLPAGTVPPNPQELLSRPLFGELLHQLNAHVDVILIDAPPAAETADAQTIAVRAGAALIVVRRNTSLAWRVQGVSTSVALAKATIVGAVLNDF